MTKPCNWQSRQNERRISALARIEAQLASNSRHNNGRFHELTEAGRGKLRQQVNALVARIRPTEQLAAVRTKKDRSGGIKFARRAA